MLSSGKPTALRRGSTAFASAAAALAGTLLGGPADAATQVGDSLLDDVAPVMLILDASASMREDDPSGGSKLAAAKSALRAVIGALPAETEVGLVIYGGRPAGGKRQGCSEIETVFPVGPVDDTAMTRAVDGLDAGGWTPIGGALRHAAGELPDTGARSVVLISDGVQTCGPPEACDAAREMTDAGTDLVVHTVGYGVAARARSELRCIADSAGGRYVEAPDADALVEELPIITRAALRAYEQVGKPVTGAPTERDAPLLGPGQFADTINSGQTGFYAVDVPEGMTVHAAATEIRPVSEGAGGIDATYLDLTLLTGAGEQCDRDRQVDSDTVWNAQNTVTVAHDSAPDGRCFAEDGRYLLRIERGGSERSLGERPVEILVAFEPPLVRAHGQSPVGPVPFAEPPGPAERVVGGGSFTHAPILDGSGVYVDQLGFGDAVFFRVRLEWGQGMAYRVRLGASDGRAVANVKTVLYSPVRGSEFPSGRETTAYLGKSTTLGPIAIPQVYHGNRTARGGTALAGLAGDYYIGVQLNPDARGAGTHPVPFELAVHVDGEPVDPPAYREIDGYPRTPLFTEPGPGGAVGEPGASAQGESGAPGPGERAVADAAVRTELDLVWPLVGVGVLIAAAVAAGTWLRLRRTGARSRVGSASRFP